MEIILHGRAERGQRFERVSLCFHFACHGREGWQELMSLVYISFYYTNLYDLPCVLLIMMIS